MKIEKQLELIEELDNGLLTLLNKKAADYADLESDTLSNFKRLSAAAQAININIHTPMGYALFMVIMKVDRINNLIGREPSNESVKDSFEDLIGYAKMAYCLSKDEE